MEQGEFMPSVEFECKHCGYNFAHVVLKGEESVASRCCHCGSRQVVAQPATQSLFGDKALFGELSKDRN